MGLALGKSLKFCTSVRKRLKLKARTFWGPNLTFVEVTWEKLVWGRAFCPPPPILSRSNIFIIIVEYLLGVGVRFVNYFLSFF